MVAYQSGLKVCPPSSNPIIICTLITPTIATEGTFCRFRHYRNILNIIVIFVTKALAQTLLVCMWRIKLGKVMLKEKLFDATSLPLLKLGLDVYSLRNRAIADNIANAETPGYQRKHVVFEEKLQKALEHRDLRRTHTRHMSIPRLDMSKLTPELKLDKTVSDVNDISNVDIDSEMADLAKTQLQFNFSARMSRLFYELLTTSIRGV